MLPVDARRTKIGHPIENVVNGDKLYYWTPDCEIFESPESVTLYFDEPVTFDVFIAEVWTEPRASLCRSTSATVRPLPSSPLRDWWTMSGPNWAQALLSVCCACCRHSVGLRKMVRLSKLTTVTAIRFTVLSTWYNYVPQVSRIGLLVEPSY